jgi:hypothetical protein
MEEPTVTAVEKAKNTEARFIRFLSPPGIKRGRKLCEWLNAPKRDARINVLNIVLARRILRAAREVNGIFKSGSPGPGHTCEGTVEGSYSCKKCLTRSVPTFPLNSWARLQDERRNANAPTVQKKVKKQKACPHCGGIL